MNQITGSCRFVWNYFLNLEVLEYQQTKKFRFLNTNSAELTKLKLNLDWLTSVPEVALQQSLKHLDQALRQSFKSNKNQKGFPKFKRKRAFDSSFSLSMVDIKKNIKPDTFYIPKVGDVKCVYHRSLPSDFKTCQIKQEAGKWFVVLTCERQEIPKQKIASEVGIDINSKEYVLSDGTIVEIPKYLLERQAKIKIAQRKLAKKKRGSNQYKKQQKKLRLLHHKVRCQRLDFFHKLTKQIIDNYDLVCLEDLKVKQIQQKLGKVISDNGFSMFRSMLEYKSELYGKHISIIDRYFPSSQLCSNCDHRQHIPLHIRTYDCPNCGQSLDRDYNASINILRTGTARFASGASQWYNNHVIICQLVGIEAGSCVR